MVRYMRVGIIGILLLFGVLFSLGSSYGYNAKGIYYDNVRYSDNVHFYGVEGLNISYSADLSKLGDSYELVFDVVNDSGVDVVITDCVYHEEDPYIHYELTYVDGAKIQEGDLLQKDDVKTIRYVVTYQNPVMDDEYEVDSSFHILYEQKI